MDLHTFQNPLKDSDNVDETPELAERNGLLDLEVP